MMVKILLMTILLIIIYSAKVVITAALEVGTGVGGGAQSQRIHKEAQDHC